MEIVLTHRGETRETQAVKALLSYYGATVQERVVSLPELARMTRGKARVHFEFRGRVYCSIDEFLEGLVRHGHIYL